MKLPIRISLPSPKRWPFWITVALAARGIFFFPIIFQPHFTELPGTWGIYGGDSESYLKPIDALLETGQYTPDFRMPGYGSLYFLMRLMLSPIAACNVIVVLQYLLSAVSAYVLSRWARREFKSDFVFYLSLIFQLISYHITIFNAILSTESFTVASFIFMVVALDQHARTRQNRYVFGAGLLMAWIIFMRPAFLPVAAIVIGVWGFQFLFKRLSFRQLAQWSALFLLPFLVVDSAWLWRNYRQHDKLIPLMDGIWYREYLRNSFPELVEFLQAWGGDYVYWNPSPEIRWFGLESYRPDANRPFQLQKPDDTVAPPESIYTSVFNRDSLLKIREQLPSVWDESQPKADYQRRNEAMKQQFLTYKESIRDEKPWLYYVGAPWKLLVKFFHYPTYHSIYPLFDTTRPAAFNGQREALMYYLKVAIEGFYEGFYYFLLFFGVIGVLLILSRMTFETDFLMAAIVGYTALIFPVILRMAEARYFVPVYPFAQVCASYALWRLYKRFVC